MSEPVIIDMETHALVVRDPLADQIDAAVDRANAHASGAMAAALEAGRLLAQAKAQVAHGAWTDWLATNCRVAPRTAQAYMRLASKLPQLSAPEAQRVADLPLREAIKAITTSPDAPPRQHGARAVTRSDTQRAADTFKAATKPLRDAAKWVQIGGLTASRAQALRTKLANAIAELDRLTTVEARP